MNFKIDLHVHTKYSGDNDAEPEEMVIRAIQRGLQGIAFTEHYYYKASEPVERLKEKYGDRIVILRGVEFSTAEGHCLVFGLDTDTLSLKYAPAEEVIQAVNRAGGVAIPSHPYRSVNSLGDLVKTVKGIRALEGYNGCNMHPFNMRAVDAAQMLNIPYTGGSDAHEPKDVGSCLTEFDDRVTEENFLTLLKAGQFRGIDLRKVSMMVNRF
ncbi:MAG TPA: PHP domain-containing protein [Nitrospirota bacterium]|nr:PHP domain-containing protein [Nitrospirota bacterium]